MQPSTTSVCTDSIRSAPWGLYNWPNNQTLYGNLLGSDTVSVQETSNFDSFNAFPISKEPALGLYDNMDVIDVIDPITSENIAMSASDGRRKGAQKRAWEAFLPLAMDIIKCSAPQVSSPSADEFQSDSDPGHGWRSRASERTDDDNEYLPTGQHTPNPRRSSTTHGASTSTSTSFPHRKRPRSDRRTHGSAPSRNKQATTDQVEDIRIKLSLCRVSRERPKDLVCPVIGCQYKQLNGRMPDYRRHVRTHIREEAEIRCKGVPWQDFVQRRHLFPNVSEQPYSVPGEEGLWIGGCLKTFSRADALKRHQRNTSCVALNRDRHRAFPTS